MKKKCEEIVVRGSDFNTVSIPGGIVVSTYRNGPVLYAANFNFDLFPEFLEVLKGFRLPRMFIRTNDSDFFVTGFARLDDKYRKR